MHAFGVIVFVADIYKVVSIVEGKQLRFLGVL